MNKGAKYFKCDFQVHTPRDLNFVGNEYVTDIERKTYSNNFIKDCRKKGIDAVAITDHHDLHFYNYIKIASIEEIDEDGNLIEDGKRIVIFPGLELTLDVPCQSILIFDSTLEMTDEIITKIYTALKISGHTNKHSSKTGLTTRLSFKSNNEVYEALDTVNELKGRFILFPNVKDGGSDSILRENFYNEYAKGIFIGGYLDRDLYEKHKTKQGWNNVIEGKVEAYGHRSIGLFQTSDNRTDTFEHLGQSVTWVKWSSPTAEGLRQACIAKKSRISQTEPELPQIVITKITVSNSKFLGSFSVEFNQQYNALIGGRGTGKSTILEYLRWGLCDQTAINFAPEEQSEIEKRSQALIDKTLRPFNGEVCVTFSVNGIIHIVKRNSVTKELVLKIGDSPFEQVKEEEIRRVLPIQAYSQKQLSSVGVRNEELKRFIQLPISNQLNDLKFNVIDNAKKTKSVYNSFVRKKEIQNEVDQFSLEIKSLTNQVENLRKQLTGIPKEDQSIISNKKRYDFEQSLVKKTKYEILLSSNKVSELISTLRDFPEPFTHDHEIENTELFNLLEKARIKKFEELNAIAKQLKDSIENIEKEEINELIAKWGQLKDAYEVQYETSKAKASTNQIQLTEIEKLELRLKDLANSLSSRNSIIKELGNPEDEFNILRTEWFQLHQQKVNLLNIQSQLFSQLSKGLIRAEITKSMDIRLIKNQITIAFAGTRISETKIQSLCDKIVTGRNPLDIWQAILDELKLLAELKISKDKNVEIPKTPILDSCDYNDGNKTRIIEVLTPENWINLATTEIEFNPEFKYTTNKEMGIEILFSEASAGQQATALLTVLLNQTGSPLIIDQPEDDIDNRAIEEIVNNIWDAKKKRQLIFTSHNANLVVNGDAELVVCCDYRETGNQTQGAIKVEGAIDFKNIRDEITSIMEGGEKAFRLRKDKYGF